jgi:putative ABC transport system substrate-binding protein
MLLAVLLAEGIPGRGVMAQRPSGVPHVGVLVPLSPEQTDLRALDAFRAGMRDLGWTEGGNVVIEVRYGNGDPVVDTTDPIGQGLVASLARPGGNLTGIANMFKEVAGKKLEILKEIAPRAGKIGVLVHRDYVQQITKDLEPDAMSLGVTLLPVGVDTVEDLPRRFDEMTAAGADGYLVIAETATDSMRNTICALALRHRLPGVAPYRRYPEAGGLLSYGASISAIRRRQAYFVDKILKGAKPADLPVERPTKFELVVNLKTAKALGLTIPRSILLRADEVIE